MYGPDTEIFFITGADVIRDIASWKDFRAVFGMCEFVAALRPNYQKESFIHEIKRLKSEFNAKIRIVDAPLIDISSTEIRNRVFENKPIRYLVPECVEEYIIMNKLYVKQ
jgi:nicotinate-nucleotide adenylyltransferase